MKVVKKVPAPNRTPVEVVVSGYTSTLKSIDVVCTGHSIPKTFSRNLVRNTPGFQWYVSRHYALKTDFSPAEAKHFLTLLELAYPHYVALFGRRLPELEDRRMCAVYGKTRESLLEAMQSDHMNGSYGYGGITQEGYVCAYQSPSNPWHSRYILLHECVHLYQYALGRLGLPNPGPWYVEGIAQYLSYTVYDFKRKQLTVCVSEADPTQGPDTVAAWFAKNRKVTFEHMCKVGDGGYSPYQCLTSFLMSSPEGLHKFHALQRECTRLWDGFSDPARLGQRLTKQLYGPWDQLNRDFRKWWKNLRRIYYHLSWGMDQDGDTLVSCGKPRASDRFSMTGIDLAPGDKPVPAPFLMDYPAAVMPATVGPIARGVDAPSVGCEIDFSSSKGKGQAGLALGRSGKLCFRALIDSEKELILDGSDMKKRLKVVRLPSRLVRAMKTDRHRIGMTVTIRSSSLVVVLRAGRKTLQEFKASVSLTRPQSLRLRTKPMAVVGVGGRHRITPFVEDGRTRRADLMRPRPANRWCDEAEPYTGLLYRSCFVLGRRAPRGLIDMRDRMLAVAERGRREQLQAVSEFKAALPKLVHSIVRSGAARDVRNAALEYLSGLQMTVTVDKGSASAVVMSSVLGGITGEVSLNVGPRGVMAGKTVKRRVKLDGYEDVRATRPVRLPSDGRPFFVAAVGRFMFHGATVTLTAEKVGNQGIDRFWLIGPLPNDARQEKGKPLAHSVHNEIEKKELNIHRYYAGADGSLVRWQKVVREPEIPVDAEHLVHVTKHLGQGDRTIAYAQTYVDVARDIEAVLTMASNDGIIAWVNGRKVHQSLKTRDWASRQDRAVIRLKKGRNKLLFKLVHNAALWFFSAAVEDRNGRPVAGVRSSLGEDDLPSAPGPNAISYH